MRFLTDADILEQVKGLASRPGKLMAAVAYWGKDAAKGTGLAEHPNRAEVRVICDLLSGACSPNEIEELTRIGVQVKTLDHLHAKVWISGHDVIVGSANASHNGLPGDDEEVANASIEAAVLSHDPVFAHEIAAWFEKLWRKSKEIEPHLDHARQLWNRRRRGGGRGFTTPLAEIICDADEHDRFAGLRLLAYCHDEPDQKAIVHMEQNFGLHYSDDEWQEFGHEHPWYEWAPDDPVWDHPPGTVFADFSCGTQGGAFDFNGFWQLRNCPTNELENIRLSLLTRLQDFNGGAFSQAEKQAIARRIREVVRASNHETDDFGSYIDQEVAMLARTPIRSNVAHSFIRKAHEISL